MTVAVIGIGQSMRGDDAAGLEAVNLWQRRYPQTAGRAELRVATIEAPGLDLLDLLGGADGALLVDAVCSGATPGALHRLGPQQLSEFRQAAGSAHTWGVAQVLKLEAALEPHQARRTVRLLAIEAAQTELGTGLSAPVAAALESACELIEAEVTSLLGI